MKLPSKARFYEKNVKTAFLKLKQGDASERELFKIINQALDNIEVNAFSGIQVPKKLFQNNTKNIIFKICGNMIYRGDGDCFIQ